MNHDEDDGDDDGGDSLHKVMNLSVFKIWDALTLGGTTSFVIYCFP